MQAITGFEVFTDPGIKASSADAQDFAALAVHQLSAIGPYRLAMAVSEDLARGRLAFDVAVTEIFIRPERTIGATRGHIYRWLSPTPPATDFQDSGPVACMRCIGRLKTGVEWRLFYHNPIGEMGRAKRSLFAWMLARQERHLAAGEVA